MIPFIVRDLYNVIAANFNMNMTYFFARFSKRGVISFGKERIQYAYMLSVSEIMNYDNESKINKLA